MDRSLIKISKAFSTTATTTKYWYVLDSSWNSNFNGKITFQNELFSQGNFCISVSDWKRSLYSDIILCIFRVPDIPFCVKNGFSLIEWKALKCTI